MKWLDEKGCSWTVDTFSLIASHGVLENLKWLFEKGCPWGTLTVSSFRLPIGSSKNETIIQWLQTNGCPDL